MYRILIRDIEMRVKAENIEVTDFGVRIQNGPTSVYVDIKEPFRVVEPAPAVYDDLMKQR